MDMRSTYKHLPWWLAAVLVLAAFAILGAADRANAAPAASHTTNVTQIFVKQAAVLETKSGKPHIGVGHAAAGSIGGCDTSGTYKSLYFKKDFWDGGTVNIQAFGDTEHVRVTGNIYYWFCKDSRVDVPDKVEPVQDGYCVSKSDNLDPWTGKMVQGFLFDPSIQNEFKNVNPAPRELEWTTIGDKGDQKCTGRQGYSEANQQWFTMNSNPGPYWRVAGTLQRAHTEDTDFDFRDAETGLYIKFIFPWEDIAAEEP